MLRQKTENDSLENFSKLLLASLGDEQPVLKEHIYELL